MKFPKRGDFVIAIVKRIFPYGAFCSLPEYEEVEAFVHVSEVAPRWIKNIHEFLHEGQHLVAKVIRVDETKQQIDISIKRVSEEEKRAKIEQVRRRARAKKLLELAIKKAKSRMKAEKLLEKMEHAYGEDVFGVFEEVLDDEHVLDSVKLPEKIKRELIALIKKSIKKATVQIVAELELICFEGNGVDIIKRALSDLDEKAKILYLGAPHYRIELTAEDYKEGNKKMERIMKEIEKRIKGHECEFSWNIVKTKK
jgi:translation initiation factor 2 subunit 1